MVQYIDEAVNVEVRLREDATALPLAFVWQGRRFQIESWGRESVKTREGHAVRCYMVQTPGPETWELCHEIEAAQWTLTRHWARNYQIV